MFQKKEIMKIKIPQPTMLCRDKEHFEKLVKRDGYCQSDTRYRMMLDQATVMDEVEASSTGQYGTITSVIRDRDGFPVCFEVVNSGGYDFISVDRVDLWEQYTYVPNCYGYYGDDPSCMCWEWED